MKKNEQQMRDALNNVGLPQLVEMDFQNPTKKELKTIKEKVSEFDAYYESGWKESTTRQTLKEYVNNWVDDFRCHSLVIC